MNKLPAFQFYPSDWRSDNGVQALSYFERGVWFEILCLMHESEQRGKLLLNGKPMSDEVLARLLGLDKQILTKALTTLLEYGVASRDDDGSLFSRRMIRDENLRLIRTESGKKGGNPSLVNQNPTKAPTKTEKQVNQKSTPSSSSSSSEEKNIKKEKLEIPLPEDFTVTEAMNAWASENVPGWSVAFETQKFCNHYRNATGKKALGKDWVAKWRTWMINGFTDFGKNIPTATTAPSKEETDFNQKYLDAEKAFRQSIPIPVGVNASAITSEVQENDRTH